MAQTNTTADARLIKWKRDYFREYVRESGFNKYIGKGANSLIRSYYELADGGDELRVPLVVRINKGGVRGGSTLVGNEQAVANYTHNVRIDWIRDAVVTNKREVHKAAFDLLQASRDTLKGFAIDTLRSDIIKALSGCNTRDSDNMIEGLDQATVAERNAWCAANSDRILFGSAKTNYSATLATALGNVDATNDKLTASVGALAKRIAKQANPQITPIRVNNESGREYFVMFCDPYAFRDLKEDDAMVKANREARARDVESNPLFQDGDLIHDGVIYREIPEFAEHIDGTATDRWTPSMTALKTAGNSSIRVAANFLCGAQSVALAWGQMPQSTTRKEDDYGFIKGVGTEECRGVEKMFFNDKQHGVVTVFTAGVAD